MIKLEYNTEEYFELFQEYMGKGYKAPYSKYYDKGRAKSFLYDSKDELEKTLDTRLFFFFNETNIFIVSKDYVDIESEDYKLDVVDLALTKPEKLVCLNISFYNKKFSYDFEFKIGLKSKKGLQNLELIFSPIISKLEKCLYLD